LQVQDINVEHALMAEATSPYGVRILVMDISLELGLLVCGDRMGNIAAFSIPGDALSSSGKLSCQGPPYEVRADCQFHDKVK